MITSYKVLPSFFVLLPPCFGLPPRTVDQSGMLAAGSAEAPWQGALWRAVQDVAEACSRVRDRRQTSCQVTPHTTMLFSCLIDSLAHCLTATLPHCLTDALAPGTSHASPFYWSSFSRFADPALAGGSLLATVLPGLAPLIKLETKENQESEAHLLGGEQNP